MMNKEGIYRETSQKSCCMLQGSTAILPDQGERVFVKDEANKRVCV